jgi:hypothetical protein
MSQLDLLPRPALKLKSEVGRTEPRLWVRKFVVWKDRKTIVREISLRRGLNIVWSPDPAEDSKEGGGTAGLGHGSGKTLFCRLLRYCLGEERFAGEPLRSQIHFAFNDGWVGAEVIIDGTCWAVIRPLGIPGAWRRNRVARDKDVRDLMKDDTLGTDIGDLIEHIEDVVLTRSVAELVAKGRSDAGWLRALAWLTRDQECRFDHVLDWRSATAGSDSPARSLSQPDLLLVLRLLIAAIDPAEFGVRDEVAALEQQRDEQIQELAHRERARGTLREQVIRETGADPESIPEGLLGAESLRRVSLRLLSALSEVATSSDIDDPVARELELRMARERDRAARANLAALDVRIAELKGELRMSRAEQPGVSAAIDSAESPVCLVCEVPIDRVLADRCKLSHKLPDLPKLRARWNGVQQSIQESELALETIQEERAAAQKAIDENEMQVDLLHESVNAAHAAARRRDDSWFATRRVVDDARRLIELESSLAFQNVPVPQAQLEKKREELAAFRDAQAPVFRSASAFFDCIISRLVAGAEGRVTFGGKGLALAVAFGGDRSTAAIDSLKVVAFDLAVLCLSVEGSTHLPAFLVHDSPREADLGLSHYHSLFDLVESLEHGPGDPLFQYIVTTTTRPPDHLAREPWLVVTLRGTPAEARLLGQDL